MEHRIKVSSDESYTKAMPSLVQDPHEGTSCDGTSPRSCATKQDFQFLQMATLSVQEAMGSKIDREAVATLVLPQLWSMSIGPCKLTEDINAG